MFRTIVLFLNLFKILFFSSSYNIDRFKNSVIIPQYMALENIEDIYTLEGEELKDEIHELLLEPNERIKSLDERIIPLLIETWGEVLGITTLLPNLIRYNEKVADAAVESIKDIQDRYNCSIIYADILDLGKYNKKVTKFVKKTKDDLLRAMIISRAVIKGHPEFFKLIEKVKEKEFRLNAAKKISLGLSRAQIDSLEYGNVMKGLSGEIKSLTEQLGGGIYPIKEWCQYSAYFARSPH